ncbi:MAG: hypothetical protein ACOYB3_01730 [Azonexus sp.]
MATVVPANAAEQVAPLNAADTDRAIALGGGLTHVGTRMSGGGQVASAAGGITWAEAMVTTAYDLVIDSAYRDALVFDQFATKRPTRLTHNGAIVSFQATNDLDDDPTKAELVEDFDVLPSKFKSAHVDIAMKEYGKVVSRTNLVRGVSMVPFDPIAAEKIGRNSSSVLDRLALNSLYAVGGISFSKDPSKFGGAGTAPVAVAPVAGKPTETLLAIAQQFQEADVEPFSNGLYSAVITPAELTALRKESDAAGWRYYQINQEESGGTGSIARRVIGEYEGFLFFVSNRLTAGKSLYLGADALAKVYPNVAGFGPQASSEVAPVVDRLRRFYTVGWLWTGGYGRYKAEAVVTSNLAA